MNVTGGIIESSEFVLIWRSISFFNILHRLILVIRSEGIIYAEGEGKAVYFYRICEFLKDLLAVMIETYYAFVAEPTVLTRTVYIRLAIIAIYWIGIDDSNSSQYMIIGRIYPTY